VNKDMVVSVRMSEDDLKQLRLIAQVNGESVGSLIRSSVKKEINRHRRSPEFRKKARALTEAYQEALASLFKK
jgi:hypothetical protein